MDGLARNVAGDNDLSSVIFCFCGQNLPRKLAVTLVVRPPATDDGSQTLFCHRHCLVKRLDPGVPHHPALDDGT